MSGCGKFPPCDGKHIQIRAGEHGIQSVLVFLQTAIHGFLVVELTLYDPKCVFNLTSHRGLAVFNVSFPVNCVVRYMRQLYSMSVNVSCVISCTTIALMVLLYHIRNLYGSAD